MFQTTNQICVPYIFHIYIFHISVKSHRVPKKTIHRVPPKSARLAERQPPRRTWKLGSEDTILLRPRKHWSIIPINQWLCIYRYTVYIDIDQCFMIIDHCIIWLYIYVYIIYISVILYIDIYIYQILLAIGYEPIASLMLWDSLDFFTGYYGI